MAKFNDSPSPEEETWVASLDSLKRQMVIYENISKGGDNRMAEAEAQKVVAAMRKVGDSHTDPKVRKEWYGKADKFANASSSERAGLFDDIWKGLLILLATPFKLAGAILFAAGEILHGTGMLVKGLGNVLTGGALSGRNSEEDKP